MTHRSTCRKAMLAAVALAVAAATATAQLGVGGPPTGHRHKQNPLPPRPHPQPNGNIPQFGDPVLGLTAAQQAAFLDGREEFESIETVAGSARSSTTTRAPPVTLRR